jgi:hypothetical protein
VIPSRGGCIRKYVPYVWSTSFANATDRFKRSRNYIKAMVPAKYHHVIIPTYRACPCFCERKDIYMYRLQLLDASVLYTTEVISSR